LPIMLREFAKAQVGELGLFLFAKVRVAGSNPVVRSNWPRPLRPSQRYESLVVSYLEVVHAQALRKRVAEGDL
jgi:hypothetical protein